MLRIFWNTNASKIFLSYVLYIEESLGKKNIKVYFTKESYTSSFVKFLHDIRSRLVRASRWNILSIDLWRKSWLRNELKRTSDKLETTRSCRTNDRDPSVHDLERISDSDRDLIVYFRYNIGSLSRGRNRETRLPRCYIFLARFSSFLLPVRSRH